MSMKQVLGAFAFACATLAATGAAYPFGITISPGGVYVTPDHNYDYDNRHYDTWGISADDAASIARHHGMRHVEDIERHSHTYVVFGQDRHHHRMTVVVDRGSGGVISID